MKKYVQPLMIMGIAVTFSGCIGGGEKTSNKSPQHKEKTMKTVTLDSGLQYEILKPAATGAKQAQNGQVVTVHYTGWLTNGTKFDSSVDRGTPFSFVLGGGQVIQGWEQGVKGMQVGEKRKLTIPARLGYGARGAGGVIPANATLIFEVELLGVK